VAQVTPASRHPRVVTVAATLLWALAGAHAVLGALPSVSGGAIENAYARYFADHGYVGDDVGERVDGAVFMSAWPSLGFAAVFAFYAIILTVTKGPAHAPLAVFLCLGLDVLFVCCFNPGQLAFLSVAGGEMFGGSAFASVYRAALPGWQYYLTTALWVAISIGVFLAYFALRVMNANYWRHHAPVVASQDPVLDDLYWSRRRKRRQGS